VAFEQKPRHLDFRMLMASGRNSRAMLPLSRHFEERVLPHQ